MTAPFFIYFVFVLDKVQDNKVQLNKVFTAQNAIVKQLNALSLTQSVPPIKATVGDASAPPSASPDAPILQSTPVETKLGPGVPVWASNIMDQGENLFNSLSL